MTYRRSTAPHSRGAKTFCFNDHSKMPSPFHADLLVDTGIFIGHFDAKDAWHGAVEDFLNTYVFDTSSDHDVKLYTTQDIINEYLHRMVENYKLRNGHDAPQAIRQLYANSIKTLIQKKSVELVDVNEKTTLDAIDRWANSNLGAKDTFHVSAMLDWGLDLITVDMKLKNQLKREPKFNGRKVYYPSFRLKK